MIGRIIEIADDQRHLFVHRGFLVVKDTGNRREELGQVPLDDISALIASAHGLSYTNNLLVALAQRGVPFVLCAPNHIPVGMLLPVEGNYEQARRIHAQYASTRPQSKRLWAAIVRSKLEQQAAVLAAIGAPDAPLLSLAKQVKSGDPGNLEAQGARRYWRLLFGTDFRRDQEAGGLNSLLNYGYTVLRAATARAVIAAGLHPSIGLFHRNANNAMQLVDDLVEPFRPIIDLKVWLLSKEGETEVNPATKRALVQSLFDDVTTLEGRSPVTVCLQKLAVSLAQVYLQERRALELPLPGLPLEMTTSLKDEEDV